MRKYYPLLAVINFYLISACQPADEYRHLPPIQFALRQVEEAQIDPELSLSFRLDTTLLGSQAYHIRPAAKRVEIIGGDIIGLMYGTLEVAEQWTLNGQLVETQKKPYLERRGIKF